MKKYTLIAEYRGGFHISQYTAEDIKAVLYIWLSHLNKRDFTELKRAQIKNELDNFYRIPEVMEGLEHVWRTTFLGGKFLMVVYIIETF